MYEIQKSSPSLPTIPTNPSIGGVSVALDTLREALNAGVEIARANEIGRTQRTAILANKEVEIAKISEEIKRGMASDRLKHEQKMELIRIVSGLLVPNAKELTPDIVSAAQMVLQTLKET